MATFRVFYRGELGEEATGKLKRTGAHIYGAFVDLSASSESDARAKFSAATRNHAGVRATAVKAA